MRKEVLISLILMSIIFLIPKAYGMHIFPLGTYDIDFDYYVSSQILQYYDSQIARLLLNFHDVVDKSLIFETIYMDRLETNVTQNQFSNFGYIPSFKTLIPGVSVPLNSYLDYTFNFTDIKYAYVCYDMRISWDTISWYSCGYVSNSNCHISVGYKDLTSGNYYWINDAPLSDSPGCVLIDLTTVKSYLQTADTRLAFGYGFNPSFLGKIYLYSIQFLTANFTTAYPIYAKYYTVLYNDFRNPDLDNRPWWGISWSSGIDVQNPTLNDPNTAYVGQDLYKVLTFNYQASQSGNIEIDATRDGIGLGDLMYNWAHIGAIFQIPDVIKKVSFIIWGGSGYNSIEFDFDRTQKKASLWLLDANRNVLQSITGLASPIPMRNVSQIIYIKEYPGGLGRGPGRILFINHIADGYGDSWAYQIPSDWLDIETFNSNSQSWIYFTDPVSSSSINMTRYELFTIGYQAPEVYTLSECAEIISPGYYRLDRDIYHTNASSAACIVVDPETANEVTIDLNGHRIVGTLNTSYIGIVTRSTHIAGLNLTIKNGVITGFKQFAIVVTNYKWLNIENLTTIENGGTPNGVIAIDTISKNLYINGLQMFDAGGNGTIALALYNIQNGTITNSNIGYRSGSSYYMMEKGIYGNKIYNVTFSNLKVYGTSYAGYFTDVHNSTFKCNFWNDVLFLDSSSTDNYGCSNVVRRLNIQNSGANLFEPQCAEGVCSAEYYVCFAQYVCLNSTYSAYQTENCTYESITYCPNGCDYNLGLCKAYAGAYCGNNICDPGENITTCPEDCGGYVPPGYVPPTNYTQPVGGVSPTEWQEAGYGWALFLFSPMFIATIIGIAGAGVVAGKVGGEQKGLVFAIVFLAFVFIFMLAGAYPTWLGIVFIIIAGALVAWFAKGAIG